MDAYDRFAEGLRDAWRKMDWRDAWRVVDWRVLAVFTIYILVVRAFVWAFS